MQSLIDRITATEQDRARASHWADHALRLYGADAAEQLERSMAGSDRVKSRRAMRLAIAQVKLRLRHKIAVVLR